MSRTSPAPWSNSALAASGRWRGPFFRRGSYRDTLGRRVLHDLGCLHRDRPRDLHVVYSKHRCEACGLYFNADRSDLAPPGSHYNPKGHRRGRAAGGSNT